MQHSSPQTRPFGRVGTHPYTPSSVQHIVVVCDGTTEGDNALQLANAISQSTGASVRAVTWLPADSYLQGDAPVERFLDRITEQLYRTTKMVGLWRLELLIGSIERELARICSEESAALVVVPGGCCLADVAPQWTIKTGIPIACASYDAPQHANGERAEHVLLHTCADARSQRHAHLAAAVIAAAHSNCSMSSREHNERPRPYVNIQTVRTTRALFLE